MYYFQRSTEIFTEFYKVYRTELQKYAFFRSSHRRCYVKKAVLKNFAVFIGKYLCLSPSLIKSLIKSSGLQEYQKGLRNRCFHVNIAKFLRTPTLKRICQQLLLIFSHRKSYVAVYVYQNSNRLKRRIENKP